MRGLSAFKSLSAIKENLPAVIFRTHGEVNPIGGAALLLDEFIKIPFRAICDVQKDSRHPNHMFRTEATDVDCAAREMIGAFSATTKMINLF